MSGGNVQPINHSRLNGEKRDRVSMLHRPKGDALAAARGTAVGLMLSVPLWGVVVLVAVLLRQ